MEGTSSKNGRRAMATSQLAWWSAPIAPQEQVGEPLDSNREQNDSSDRKATRFPSHG